LIDILNNIETSAVTGANSASYNTGPGDVEDGNATVNTQTANVANTNAYGKEETFWLVLVNKMGQWIGNIVGSEGEVIAGNLVVGDSLPEFSEGDTEELQQAANVVTGADSENISTASQDNTTAVTNTNDAKIENNIKINAVSGNNSGSYNTLGGDVSAGDATVGLSLVNFINTNLVGKKLIVLVIDVLGEWIGDVIPPGEEKNANNSNTGSNVVPNNVIVEDNTDNGQEEENVLGLSDFGSTYYQEPVLIENDLVSNYMPNQWGSFNYGPVSALNLRSEGRNIQRGLFFSPVFAMETDLAGMPEPIKVTQDWLYVLVPSLCGVVASKNKRLRSLLASFL
jgi:hypothetical protein